MEHAAQAAHAHQVAAHLHRDGPLEEPFVRGLRPHAEAARLGEAADHRVPVSPLPRGAGTIRPRGFAGEERAHAAGLPVNDERGADRDLAQGGDREVARVRLLDVPGDLEDALLDRLETLVGLVLLHRPLAGSHPEVDVRGDAQERPVLVGEVVGRPVAVDQRLEVEACHRGILEIGAHVELPGIPDDEAAVELRDQRVSTRGLARVGRLVRREDRPPVVREGDLARRQVVERAEHQPLEVLARHEQRPPRGGELGDALIGGAFGAVLLVQVGEHAVQRAGQHLAQQMWLVAGRLVGAAQLVERVVVGVQVPVVPEGPEIPRAARQVALDPELLRQPGVRHGPADRAVGLLQQPLPQLAAAQGDHEGADVGDRFVQREGLRSQAVVEVGRDAVEDRVARLVGDDVLGERGEDRPRLAALDARGREVEELEAAGSALVERVGPLARAGDHEELRRAERPLDLPPQRVALLEQVQGAEDRGERVDLQELLRAQVGQLGEVRRLVAPGVVARATGDEAATRAELAGLGVEVEDRDAAGHRAVQAERLAVEGDLLGGLETLRLLGHRVLDEVGYAQLHSGSGQGLPGVGGAGSVGRRDVGQAPGATLRRVAQRDAREARRGAPPSRDRRTLRALLRPPPGAIGRANRTASGRVR